ncbi:MAG: exosortase A [Novosphingobium sp.]|nr:exosortase A [Novosphingobium sp.]
MPRNATAPPFWRGLQWPVVPDRWRSGLRVLVLAVIAQILAFLPDWAAMAGQWWNSSTYNHILLVPAIIAWAVWQRAEQVLKLTPSPWWPGLILAGGAAFVWLLGAFSGLSTARHLGVVTMIMATVITMLGPKASTGLAFPLGYMLFLVPVGDEFVPALQMITAAITIALVHLSGIEATINGVFIDTPVGLFEVAEACSGVKFLVAMIAFGVLVANLCFVSWRRRVVFLAACVIVPILANGVRAWGTIYAAQFFGVEAAAGFDHIVYGWFFFAIVIAVMLAGSWRFFDREVDAPLIDEQAIGRSALLGRMEAMRAGTWISIAALALLFAGAQTWAREADRLQAEVPRQVWLPEVAGWHRIDYAPAVWWEPRASGADHRLLGSYSDHDGHKVDVFVAIYSSQGEGREAGGHGEGALGEDGAWSWLSPGSAVDTAASDRLLANGNVERVALTWYHTGSLTSGSNLQLKFKAMSDRLFLRARPTVLLILSAEENPGQDATAVLKRFRRDIGPIDIWMDDMATVR